MLQLQIKRGLLILAAIIFLSGCEANYTITIDKDTINEKIEVLDKVSDTRTVTDIMDNYKKKYPVYNSDEIVDDSELYQYNPELTYYNQTYNIDSNGYHLYYEYTYPIDKYIAANSINYSYDYKDIVYQNNKLKLETSSPNNYLKYRNIFTGLTVNIITDYVVTNNNADSIIGNRYIWYFNKENNYDKRINFEVDLTKTQSEVDKEEAKKGKKNSLLIPVLIGALLAYVIIIFIIVTKKRKNEW